MGYAVFHATKGSGSGGKLGAHIDRDPSQKQTYKSADPDRLHLNKNLLNNEYSKMKLEDAIKNRISEGYTGKKVIRKDAVKFIPMVMTGSPNEMKEIFKDMNKVNAWIKENYLFACKEFGKENIVRCTLHMDEKTPHLHIVAIPLTKDGRLSAKEVFGDVKKLSERQDRYAAAMKQFGLERGIKGSKAVHTSEGWYIAKQKEAEKAFSDPLKQLGFFERVNPLKKIEVLSESLKLAVNHKFDSDQKAQREEQKVLVLSKENDKLKEKINLFLGDEKEFQKAQMRVIEKLQQNFSYEVRRQVDNKFSLHKYSPEERKKFVANIIIDTAKREKNLTEELYQKTLNHNDFAIKMIAHAENRAQQSQEREQRNQTRGNRLGY